MATKITTKKISEIAAEDLHVLITQTEDDIVSLRRMPARVLFDKYGVNGLNYTEDQLQLMCGNAAVGVPVTIQSGSGGGDFGSTMRLSNLMESRTFTVMDTAPAVEIAYNVTSVDTETEEATGNISVEWYVGSSRVYAGTVSQGDNTYDVKKHLVSGAYNTVRLVATDPYGNSKSMTWTITVAVYGLTWNLSDFGIYNGESLTLRLVPTGTGEKIVKVKLDDTVISEQTVSTTGRAVAVTVAAQTHGAHRLTAWMEVDLDGQNVTTETLTHVGVWVDPEIETPIVAFLQTAVTVPVYGTAEVKWIAYDPARESATVVRSVVGTDITTSLTVDRTPQIWGYRPISTGTQTLSVVCGTACATCTCTATELDYDIAPVTRSLSMSVDPSGHTNAEANRTSFGYSDTDGTNHPFTFSDNFDWVNGGFKVDDEGVTAFVIKRGTSITCDRSLFADDAKVNGKEIKMIFAVKECRSGTAEIASCKSGSIGLHMQAHQVTLSSEAQTITALYCENKKIEMDINIESSNENRIAMIWLEGIPSRVTAYGNADNWTQSTPAKLTIGSADCDVWLYRFKLYDSSLTRYEILDNFVADCANPTEMVDRYERNNIYNTDGTINRQKLSAVSPELRILHIVADRMTTSKSDNVNCSVELLYGNGGAERQFTAVGVTMKAQGTSSLEYLLAALNLDLDFSKATWTNGNGEFISDYAMTENSIPVDYFNVKLNVASSENANNVCAVDEYNTFQPNLCAAREANPKVRDTVEGHPCAVFFTNNTTSAISVGARTVQPGETIMYGVGDMNNSKKNFAVFGQDNNVYPEQCCIEIMNNNNPQCLFKSDDLTGETWDGGNFEFRFPANPTDAMKSRWQQLLSWVVSTDRTAATGTTLEQPVTYDGVAYAADTVAYRAAKFKDEIYNYFHEGDLEYHYLFTERHLLVDNRAKNCFVSYEYFNDVEGYRWTFRCDYDNDTFSGNDNSGGMTFTYGLEDVDSVGAAKVFNASDSVLWCNVRDLLFPQLVEMYKDRESAGAWNADRICAKWKAHQSARPEALMAEDTWGKYLSPYINKGETRFLNIAYGTKEDQLRQFETDQEAYIASKYGGSTSTSDRISLRTNAPDEWAGVEPSGDISDIVPFSDIYITVKYGNAGTQRIRAKAGYSYNVTLPEGASLNDLETYIYSASRLSSIGPLAALYSKLAELASATRLQQFLVGSGEVGYSNGSMTSISFGQNFMMEKIDLRGTPQLAQALDLSALTALKELYTEGSGVTGVTFARNSPVKIAKLGSIRTLVARDLASVETFSVGNALQSVWIEGCSDAVDTQSMLMAATGLTRGRVLGVNWSLNNADLLLRLASLSGLDANGDNTSHFVLTGECYVYMLSQDELDTINAAFPELSITYNTMLSTFVVTFKNYDGTILNTQHVRQYGDAKNPVTEGLITTPTKPPTVDKVFTFSAWDKPITYITQDLEVTATYSETARTYTVKWWNGLTLLQTSTVEVYDNGEYTGDIPYVSGNDIFTGWSVATTNVQEDINTYAQFESASIPAAKATDYDYLYSDDPDDNSAYTLGEFVGIINSGQASSWFEIGDKIKMVTPTKAFADTTIILSFTDVNHFKLADESGMAKAFFLMIGAMTAPYKHHTTNINTGGYPASDINTYLETVVFPNLPLHWQSITKLVQRRSSVGDMSPEIVMTDCHLMIPVYAECFPDGATAVPYKNEVDPDADNITFTCFTDNNSRIRKTFNSEGSAVGWWLGSPDPTSALGWRLVYTNGNANSFNASNSYSLVWGLNF